LRLRLARVSADLTDSGRLSDNVRLLSIKYEKSAIFTFYKSLTRTAVGPGSAPGMHTHDKSTDTSL